MKKNFSKVVLAFLLSASLCACGKSDIDVTDTISDEVEVVASGEIVDVSSDRTFRRSKGN